MAFLQIVFGLALLQFAAASEYPSTFPFDGVLPVEYVPFPDPTSLPKSTGDATGPTFTFVHESMAVDLNWAEWEDSLPESGIQETGGYLYLQVNDLVINGAPVTQFEDCASRLGYTFSEMSFKGLSFWRFHGSLPENMLNCSAIPTYAPIENIYPLAAEGAFGEYSEFCTPGENCCERLNGLNQWNGATAVEGQAETPEKLSTTECATLEVEYMCQSLSHVTRLLCNNYIVSDTERLFMVGCHDVTFIHTISCAAYMDYDVAWSKYTALNNEFRAYSDLLSVRELIGAGAITRNIDRVCWPYMYFYPDFTGLADWDLPSGWPMSTSSTSSSATTSSAATSSAATTATSSAATTAASSAATTAASPSSATLRLGITGFIVVVFMSLV